MRDLARRVAQLSPPVALAGGTIRKRAAAVGLAGVWFWACRPTGHARTTPLPCPVAESPGPDSARDRRSFLFFNVWTSGSTRPLAPYGIRIQLGSGSDAVEISPPVAPIVGSSRRGDLPNRGRYEVDSTGTLPITVTVVDSATYHPSPLLATANVTIPLRPFWSWVVSIDLATSRPDPGSFMSPVAKAVPVRGADSLFIMVGGESRGLPFHVH